MKQREYYEKELNNIIVNPKNKFDRFLKKYKKYFKVVSEDDIIKTFVIREKAYRYSAIKDMKLCDLKYLLDNNAIELTGNMAKLIWCYDTIELTYDKYITKK